MQDSETGDKKPTRERSPVRINTAHESMKPELVADDPEAGEVGSVQVGGVDDVCGYGVGLPPVRPQGGKAKLNFGKRGGSPDHQANQDGAVTQNFLGGSGQLQKIGSGYLNSNNYPVLNPEQQGSPRSQALEKSNSLSPRSRTLLAAGSQAMLPSVAEEAQPLRRFTHPSFYLLAQAEGRAYKPASNSDSFHSLASNAAAQDPLTAFGNNGRLARPEAREDQTSGQQRGGAQRINPRIKHANQEDLNNPTSDQQHKDLRGPTGNTSGLPSMLQNAVVPDENMFDDGHGFPSLPGQSAIRAQRPAAASNLGNPTISPDPTKQLDPTKPLEAAEIEKILKEDQEKKKKKLDDREVVISMDNIQKTYLIGIEGVTAVRGVNLKVHKGEFLCILGTSGGGKSTLLNCMGTIDTPSRGTLKLFGNLSSSIQ